MTVLVNRYSTKLGSVASEATMVTLLLSDWTGDCVQVMGSGLGATESPETSVAVRRSVST